MSMALTAMLDLMHQALEAGFFLLVLPVGMLFVVGLVVGLLQAVTQLQDPSISFVPKALALTAFLFALGPWLFTAYAHFVVRFWLGGLK